MYGLEHRELAQTGDINLEVIYNIYSPEIG